MYNFSYICLKPKLSSFDEEKADAWQAKEKYF